MNGGFMASMKSRSRLRADAMMRSSCATFRAAGFSHRICLPGAIAGTEKLAALADARSGLRPQTAAISAASTAATPTANREAARPGPITPNRISCFLVALIGHLDLSEQIFEGGAEVRFLVAVL